MNNQMELNYNYCAKYCAISYFQRYCTPRAVLPVYLGLLSLLVILYFFLIQYTKTYILICRFFYFWAEKIRKKSYFYKKS